jgi:hypothetical protein
MLQNVFLISVTSSPALLKPVNEDIIINLNDKVSILKEPTDKTLVVTLLYERYMAGDVNNSVLPCTTLLHTGILDGTTLHCRT